MAKQKHKSSTRKSSTHESSTEHKRSIHPGSSTQDAKAVGGKGDFGVPEGDVLERTYTSQNTKRSDRGGVPPRSGDDDSRVSGAGGSNSGPGSSSGGDVDLDLSLYTTGGTDAPPVRQTKKAPAKSPALRGSTVQPPDEISTGPQGADAASRPEEGDDSFVGEVSSDEASGRNDAGD
jgi:hypothetical protein